MATKNKAHNKVEMLRVATNTHRANALSHTMRVMLRAAKKANGMAKIKPKAVDKNATASESSKAWCTVCAPVFCGVM